MAIATPAPRERPSWPLLFFTAFFAFRPRDASHKPRHQQARQPDTRALGTTHSTDAHCCTLAQFSPPRMVTPDSKQNVQLAQRNGPRRVVLRPSHGINSADA